MPALVPYFEADSRMNTELEVFTLNLYRDLSTEPPYEAPANGSRQKNNALKNKMSFFTVRLLLYFPSGKKHL